VTRAALVISHPGHELRVHGWLERIRPYVFVLTDGSGHGGRSRLASTTRVLARAGAEPGSIYGRFTDREFYARILSGRPEFFLALADELAQAFSELEVDVVAGDACEGYNPTHDLCRSIVDTAVAIAGAAAGRPVASFDFQLVGAPDSGCERRRARTLRLELGDLEMARKLAAAQAYAELAGEVRDVLRDHPIEAFRVECLRSVDGQGADDAGDDPPYYERYGESQVASGHYARVIRYREHVLPVARALRRHAQASAS
jgi:AcrR family transcriptional regulator